MSKSTCKYCGRNLPRSYSVCKSCCYFFGIEALDRYCFELVENAKNTAVTIRKKYSDTCDTEDFKKQQKEYMKKLGV